MNKEKLQRKLTEITGEDNYMTKTKANILAVNYINVDNNIIISKAITQTNGVLQGDPLGLLLFNIATINVPKAIRTQEGILLPVYVHERYGNNSKTYRQLAGKFQQINNVGPRK
jgi:hypothetical protein